MSNYRRFFMSFKFSIEKTDEIKSAKIYCLEGFIQEGSIQIGDCAHVEINGQSIGLEIQSIVGINRNRLAEYAKKITISINKPECNLKELEGKVLISA